MKVGSMWPLEAAVGSCGSVRVHSAADCWTCPWQYQHRSWGGWVDVSACGTFSQVEPAGSAINDGSVKKRNMGH